MFQPADRPFPASHRRALLCAATVLAAGLVLPGHARAQDATSPSQSTSPNATPPAQHKVVHKTTRHKKTTRATGTHAAATASPATMAPVAAGTAAAPAYAASSSATTGGSTSIVVRAQQRLVRQRNAPSAVTELGTAEIAQTGIQGSVATLLRNAPSVYVYQQGIGNNEPVLSIRGVRGLEVAETLDGIPMQDLQYGGSGAYLNSVVSGPFNLDQIGGVSILPGVAYPNQNTFGTIGGTVAYSSLRPDAKRSMTVTGSVGSFGTYNEGIELQSGKLDGFLGEGVDAPSMMVKYSNMQTKGYVDYTPARYNNLYFAFDKPYNQGTSKFQATMIYNTGSGLVTPEPIPEPYTQQNGTYSNYAPSDEFMRQNNDYFTLMLNNDSYINDWLSAGVSAFYRYSDTTTQSYGNPEIFAPDGEDGSVTVGGASPFNQTVAGFASQSAYGPGGPEYDPQVYTYNGANAACPADVTARWAAAGQTGPCGYNAEYTVTHTDTYGIRPRLTITPPRLGHGLWAVDNTIEVGALVAKSTSPATKEYLGSTPNVDANPANLVAGYDGGTQRTIYQGYAQDRIDLFHNTLHITPGVTLEGSDSSLLGSKIYGGTPSASLLATSYCQAGNDCLFGSYKAHKWDREWLPFLNVAYDFDKIAPRLRGLSVYGSMGESALFAPVSDFGPNLTGSPPSASIVHMYEGGIKYDTSKVAISLDYFYQHIERDFGFFEDQNPSSPTYGQESYTDNGQREMKGIEGSVKWQVTPDLQLFGNFSKTLAKYLATSLGDVTVQEDQFGIVQRGTPVTGVPEWVSTFGVDYHHKNSFLKGDTAGIRFTGQYTGRQHTSYDLNGFQNVGPIAGFGSYGSYTYYNATTGSTTYDPNGGIAPFMVFIMDANYTMPIKGAGPLHQLGFDLNIFNLFNQHYHQYYYKQVSPSSCGTFTSGPFAGQGVNPYGCSTQFADSLPGEPFAVTFSMSAKF